MWSWQNQQETEPAHALLLPDCLSAAPDSTAPSRDLPLPAISRERMWVDWFFGKYDPFQLYALSYITNTPWNINSTAFLFMLFVPAAPQKVPNRTSTLTAPSSLVWRDLVKSESSYSTNKKRCELETSDSSHLESTYVPYHLADLMDELLEKTGWGGTNCSYLPFAASRACSLQHSLMCTVST